MTDHALSEETSEPKTRRTRRAAAKKKNDDAPAARQAGEHAAVLAPAASTAQAEAPPPSADGTLGATTPKRRTHRGGRGRKKHDKAPAPSSIVENNLAEKTVGAEDHDGLSSVAAANGFGQSRIPEAAGDGVLHPGQDRGDAASHQETEAAQTAKSKSRRSRRGGRGRSKGDPARQNGDTAPAVPQPPADQAAEPDSQQKAVAQAARKESAQEKEGPKSSKRKMFISVVPGEQVEVVLTEQGGVCEYYLEMFHQAKIKGNIYRGVVHNIDKNLQAAFVSYGGAKNGFLQIDEVHPEYWLNHHEESGGKKYPPIQKALKVGQEVLIQVVKEPSGTKGAFLTTWISLAGRFLVLTPGQEQIGVSRKVEEEGERVRLRELMNGIDPGAGLGVIVRTVSAGTNKTTLQKDLQYLKRLWKEIRAKAGVESAPALVYQEPGLARRAVRDYLTDDINEVWVDDEAAANDARETINLLFPRKTNLVRLHQDPGQSLWERFDIQRQLEQIYSREISLPSGGRLIFDQTEALMAIDINSGRIHGKSNFESMALKTNLEAAETIARQLRLRDIGGQVVIDFIEMRDKNHVRDVEKVLRQAMKSDRARHDIGRIGPFGLLELVRQRTGSSALAITTELCPCCNGSGLRRNMEWQALQTLRGFSRQMRDMNPGSVCTFELPLELGLYLLNEKRERLRELEKLHSMHIEIRLLRV